MAAPVLQAVGRRSSARVCPSGQDNLACDVLKVVRRTSTKALVEGAKLEERWGGAPKRSPRVGETQRAGTMKLDETGNGLGKVQSAKRFIKPRFSPSSRT